MISTSSHDDLMISCPLLVGKSGHAHGHLSGGSHSKQNAEANALIAPLIMKREMAAPSTHCDTLPQVL